MSLVIRSLAEEPVSVLMPVKTGAGGGLLCTINVALGPALGAVLPVVSVAVPAAIEIPNVPSPVMLEMVTVRVAPLPLTPTDEAAAEPVAFTVMLAGASVLELKFASA